MPTSKQVEAVLKHVYDNQPGMIDKGNIDPYKRPIVHNEDGSISTTRSFSVNMDGKEVLLPLISPTGRVMTPKEAVEEFQKTGKHFGTFDTPENADKYSNKMHDLQVLDLQEKGVLKKEPANETEKLLDSVYGPAQKPVQPHGPSFRGDLNAK